MFFSMLLLVATQAVPEDVQQRVRTEIERAEPDFLYEKTFMAGGRDPMMSFRMKSPPEENRSLSKGARESREGVTVTLMRCTDARAAKARFDEDLARDGRGPVVEGLGAEAIRRSVRGEETLTTIGFRMDQYVVYVSAPTGAIGRHFGHAVEGALLAERSRR